LSNLNLDHNKNKIIDALQTDQQIKELKEKALHLINKNNIKVIDVAETQKLIDETNTSTFFI
jgi:hypothetical protein